MSKENIGKLLTESQMLEAEAEKIWGDGAQRPDETSGIALSGGGVRAAIVALGVLQSLAEHGILSKLTYMSTVSGGGYIASALQWYWSDHRLQREKLAPEKSRFGSTKADFPFQDREAFQRTPSDLKYPDLPIKDKAAANLEFLRNNASYLTAGDGIGLAAIIIAVVRTVLVSLLIWIPVLVFSFWLLDGINWVLGEYIAEWLCSTSTQDSWCQFFAPHKKDAVFFGALLLAALLLGFFVLAVVTLAWMTPGELEEVPTLVLDRVKAVLRYFGLALVLVLFNWWLFSSFGVLISTGTIGFLSVFGFTFLVASGGARFHPFNTSYLLRRLFDHWSYAFLPGSIAVLFFGLIPYIVENALHLSGKLGTEGIIGGSLGGVIALLSGVSTALYGYYTKAKSIVPGLAPRTAAVVGSVVFIAGLFLCAFTLSRELQEVKGTFSPVVILTTFVVAIVLGLYSSVNATGLHRFYRDRLMESFMPMAPSVSRGKADASFVADTLSITEIWDHKPSGRRPYHLVNAHAILIGDDVAKVVSRGGDNFTMSAAVVGSTATGWMRTDDYIKGNGPLTLASAVAASGAAANANAGYIGTGITRERFVSVVMAFLNIRLGLWIANPSRVADRPPNKVFPHYATYFGPPFVSGMLNRGYSSKSTFIELSDGGHFENLGLYELIRRKARLIIAVDAEQDEAINLSSLVSSTNRVREDFGAVIKFLESRGPEVLIGQESHQYPGGVRIAKSPYIVGKVIYADGTNGVLIYIKATMISGLDFATDGYRASNPDFPHQTTVDQFFDPQQFEAYRDLGRKSANLAVKELGLKGNPTPEEILREYGFEKRLS